jgi:hypothetical protein
MYSAKRRQELCRGAAEGRNADVQWRRGERTSPTSGGEPDSGTKLASKSVFVRGLNAMIGTVSNPTAPPLIANARLRSAGNAVSVKGAPRFLTETVATARAAGATGMIVTRTDSGFYAASVVATCRRQGVHFSITAPQNAAVRATCEAIDETAWTPIRYPKAVWDEDLKEWISDAQIAETTYTTFAHTPTPMTARLVVRRVRALNRKAGTGQGELFPTWALPRGAHRQPVRARPGRGRPPRPRHRRAGQRRPDQRAARPHALRGVHRERRLAHPRRDQPHLLRAACTLASPFHARARGATLRAHLVNIPGRLARHGRGRLTASFTGRRRGRRRCRYGTGRLLS